MQGSEQNVFQDFKEPQGAYSLIGITGFICQREFKEARLRIYPESIKVPYKSQLFNFRIL